MAVSRFDRVYDSDQNRKDYCIKWLYISSKWDVKKEHKQKTESVILLAAARFFSEFRLGAETITESLSDTFD